MLLSNVSSKFQVTVMYVYCQNSWEKKKFCHSVPKCIGMFDIYVGNNLEFFWWKTVTVGLQTWYRSHFWSVEMHKQCFVYNCRLKNLIGKTSEMQNFSPGSISMGPCYPSFFSLLLSSSSLISSKLLTLSLQSMAPSSSRVDHIHPCMRDSHHLLVTWYISHMEYMDPFPASN